jgi:tyrosyl-tRNA synthetase
VPRTEFESDGLPLVNLLVMTRLALSRGDARRLIEGGGIYINNVRANDATRAVLLGESIEGQFVLLRKGKKNYHLVRMV